MCKGRNSPHFELDVSQALQAFRVLPSVSDVDVGVDGHVGCLPLPPQGTIQTSFASRRGFSESAGTDATNFNLNYNGREWYFNRIAFSYTYTF